MPAEFEKGPTGKAHLAEYITDKKDWKADIKNLQEQKKSIFFLLELISSVPGDS